jgi:two-component system, OmpR family, sensor kinase
MFAREPGADGSAFRHPVHTLRRLSERTPLRVKLITALLALVVLALAVISFTSISFFQAYLINQTDTKLSQLLAGIANNEPGAMHDPFSFTVNGTIVEVLDGNLNVVPAGNYQDFSNPPAIPASSAWLNANDGHTVTVPGVSGSTTWRVLVERPVTYSYYPQGPTGPPQTGTTGTLIVGQDLGPITRTISYLNELDVIVSLVIVLGLGVLGVAVVRANLRPLDDIEATAEQIAAGHLNRRVPDRDPRTEIGRLGRSINTMLSQIESAFHAREKSEEAAVASEERMRRFIADASHELRTPLTAIRGFAEYYRQRGGVSTRRDVTAGQHAAMYAEGIGHGAASGQNGVRGFASPTRPAANGDGLSPEELDQLMQRVEGEAARMGVLVEDLLLLARLDQQRPLQRQPVDLLVLAADAVQDTRMIAPGRPVDLTVEPGAAFLVTGDEVRLRQVIGNLMSNALAYTPDGSPIDVRLGLGVIDTAPESPGAPARTVRAAVLDVADQGPGLTPEQAQRVFERFYRADQARTRKNGGSGLGLSIVSALVSAHGGTATVQSVPGQGATFRITLPLAQDAADWDAEPDTGPQARIAGPGPGSHWR